MRYAEWRRKVLYGQKKIHEIISIICYLCSLRYFCACVSTLVRLDINLLPPLTNNINKIAAWNIKKK